MLPTALDAALSSVPIAPILQISDYDCGLACAAMVVRCAAERRGPRCPSPPQIPPQPRPPVWVPEAGGGEGRPREWNRDFVYAWYEAASGGNRSVWTVDLFLLLHQLLGALGGVRLEYYTTEVGCRAEYSGDSFYSVDFDADERRVARLFKSAFAAKLRVSNRRLQTPELVALLRSEECLLVVLVDARLLPRSQVGRALRWCGGVVLQMCCCFMVARQQLGGYLGHYVVASGYDTSKDEVVCVDPARWDARRSVPLELFERARSAYGTDDDVIVVHLPLASPSAPDSGLAP
eukprot:Hpha_TRINITY_DN34589_c0_g1::TRINITY_DN34589_c0_g1_i1::g.96452::m.96452